MNELDRILDGNNMGLLLLVDGVNQRCQRGALSRTSGTSNQNQSFRGVDQTSQLLREIEFMDSLDGFRNQAKDRADSVSLHEYVYPKAAHAVERVAKIQIAVFGEEF